MSKISPPAPPIAYGGGTEVFKNADFHIYKVNKNKEKLKLWLKNSQGVPYQNIGNLKKDLAKKGEEPVFVMNAGMYTQKNLPQGLYISNKKQEGKLDTTQVGYGNFYLQPNGVFAFDGQKAVIKKTMDYYADNIAYSNATQSGPMLVINGEIHAAFNEDSKNKFIRNGVGIDRNGEVIFAYSTIPVNFYHFAELFLTKLQCNNALYLDGAISKIYLPQVGRRDTAGNLGPLIGISKPMKKQQKTKKQNIQKKIQLPDANEVVFENKKYRIFKVNTKKQSVNIFFDTRKKEPFHNVKKLMPFLSNQNKKVAMLTNGGSYQQIDSKLRPEGLLIKNYEVYNPLNLKDGDKNFYLKPNGVLYQSNDRFHIHSSEAFSKIIKYEKIQAPDQNHIVQADETLWGIAQKYKVTKESIIEANQLTKEIVVPAQELIIPIKKERINENKSINIPFAIQSGPMLVINGTINDKFTKGSSNLHIRSGVGIAANGQLVFAISKQKVNFYEFASLFKQELMCNFAICLDSGHSVMHIANTDNWEELNDKNYGYFLTVTTP